MKNATAGEVIALAPTSRIAATDIIVVRRCYCFKSTIKTKSLSFKQPRATGSVVTRNESSGAAGDLSNGKPVPL